MALTVGRPGVFMKAVLTGFRPVERASQRCMSCYLMPWLCGGERSWQVCHVVPLYTLPALLSHYWPKREGATDSSFEWGIHFFNLVMLGRLSYLNLLYWFNNKLLMFFLSLCNLVFAHMWKRVVLNVTSEFCGWLLWYVDIFKHSRARSVHLLTKFKQISIFWAKHCLWFKKKTSCSSTLLILWTDNSETLRK